MDSLIFHISFIYFIIIYARYLELIARNVSTRYD